MTWGADDDIVFTQPNGARLQAAPAPPRWDHDAPPLAPMTDRLTSAGIVIGPKTALPYWHGERFNVGWAIDVLRQDEAFSGRPRYVPAETRPPRVQQDLT